MLGTCIVKPNESGSSIGINLVSDESGIDQALADALETLIINPDLRDQMGRSGRQFALEKFSLDKIIQQTLAVYPKLF